MDYILYFRNLSKVQGWGSRFETIEEALDVARRAVEMVKEDAPNQDATWFIMRIGDGIVFAEYNREMPVASPVFALIKNFHRANDYLANVIEHPENWYSHQLAIESAKELVYDRAQALADYRI